MLCSDQVEKFLNDTFPFDGKVMRAEIFTKYDEASTSSSPVPSLSAPHSHLLRSWLGAIAVNLCNFLTTTTTNKLLYQSTTICIPTKKI